MKNSKDKPDFHDLLLSAKLFHGHLGPFLILGLRAGLLGLKKFDLKRGLNGLITNVSLQCKPPYSCILDGIQVSTGCTIGNGNMKVKESSKIEILFKNNKGRQLIISINPHLLNHLKHEVRNNAKDNLENSALYLNSLDDENLFIMKYS